MKNRPFSRWKGSRNLSVEHFCPIYLNLPKGKITRYFQQTLQIIYLYEQYDCTRIGPGTDSLRLGSKSNILARYNRVRHPLLATRGRFRVLDPGNRAHNARAMEPFQSTMGDRGA